MAQYEEKLTSYLFGKTRRGLLALLFGRPDESFYVNQIIQRLGSGSGAVQRELRIMVEAGLAVRERRGNLVYYRANEGCPIFNEVRSIVTRTIDVTGGDAEPVDLAARRFRVPKTRLAEYCRKHHIIRLSLFGSVLTKDFRPDSDIDVLVQFEPGQVPGFGIVDMETELSQKAGRKVDMRTHGDLSRYFRERVMKEAKEEYVQTEPSK